MHSLTKVALTALLALLFTSPATSKSNYKPPGQDAILLSNVQTLTLRAHRMTSARRVSPIPQLSCAGPSKRVCNLYQPEVMRCTNQGYDYDAEDVQWTCTTDLPAEFKLGATDVICEGYRNADDKWVLKGSCGVEYRLLLTEAGERRYGKQHDDRTGKGRPRTKAQNMASMLVDLFFFVFIAAVFAFIFWRILAQCFGWGTRRARRPGQAPGWGGGGGGGGGGGNDPPPPYSSFDPYKSAGQRQGWKPGFWTGALGGGAAGYQMGRRSGNASQGGMPMGRYGGYDPYEGSSGGYDPGEGSSRSSPQFSSTTASTGFGSTRRR